MTKDEMIAISLLAATDDVSTAEAERLLNLGRDAEHSGDCRQQPWTCMRCHHDDYLKMAGQIQVNLELFGLRIAELESFADRIYALALRGQSELEEHDLPEVNGSLVEIAEAAQAMRKE